MSLLDAFARVSRRQPCPVCQRGDWCLVSREGGDTPVAAICARIENSNRWGEAGWFHRLAAQTPAPRRSRTRAIPGPGRDFSLLAERFRSNCCTERREALARSLGVTSASLRRLGLGWTGWAWSFPMFGSDRNVCGVRLRRPDGRKLSKRCSREGLFLPEALCASELLIVCEGPTDTAALLDLEFEAIGRPSCSGGGRLVAALVRRVKPLRVVVLVDADDAGRNGGERLAAQLHVVCRSVRIIEPRRGAGDAREWVNAGASTEEVRSAIELATPLQMKVCSQRRARS